MSEMSMAVAPEEQRELERFYHYEARLLDNREYQQWLALVDPGILDLAHQVDEWVDIDDMVDAAKVMASATASLVASGMSFAKSPAARMGISTLAASRSSKSERLVTMCWYRPITTRA